MFDEEQKAKVSAFKKVINSIDFPFKILSIDKQVNLDHNLNLLSSKINSTLNEKKVKILKEDYEYLDDVNNLKAVINREFYIIFEEDKSNEELLKQKTNDILREFFSIGLVANMVTSEEWRELLYTILNPLNSLDLFKNDGSSITKSFKEKIAPHGLKINERDLVFGDAYMSVLTLITYPSNVDVAWLGDVANVNNTRMTMTICPTNPQEISSILKKSIAEIKSKMININDYNEQILYNNQMQDYTDLVNDIDRNHEKFNLITINFLCYGSTIDELNNVKKNLKSTLSSYGMYATDLMFDQERSLKMCLPTMYTDLVQEFGLYIPQLTLAASFPFIFQNLQDEEDAILLGQDISGSLSLFNMWQRTDKRVNSNGIVIGKSGSGKSTFVKKLIRGEWARGSKIIVIDPERELKDFCESIGGTWIDAGTGTSGIINPLEVRISPASDSDDIFTNDLSRHFQTFRTFIKYYFQDLSIYELTKLEDVLIELYADKNITFETDLTKLKSTDYPIMQDLYNKVSAKLNIAKNHNEPKSVIESLEKICAMLKRATTGADARIFNGYSSINVNSKSDFIVFDINSLIDSDAGILRTQFFNILTWCWNEICFDKNERVILMCDEAHLLIDPNNPDALEFFKRSSKRNRKQNASLWLLTQNLIDFTAKEVERYGQVIIDNSAYIFVMAQGQKEIDAVQKMLNLSESERYFLTTASRGQGLFVISQDTRLPIEILLRDEEKNLFGNASGN